jgi:flagellar protein FlaJ
MARLDKLGKLLKRQQPKKEDKKEKKTDKQLQKEMEEDKEVDTEALEKVVQRMRSKYIKEGILREEETPGRSSFRRRVTGIREDFKPRGASPEELRAFESPAVRFFGSFYLALGRPFSKLSQVFHERFGRRLELDLLASQSKFSPEQYLSITLGVTFFIWVVTIAILVALLLLNLANPVVTVVAALFVPILTLIVMLRVPSSNALRRANNIDKELPFALRHMSIEIRAGVGIYKTMESISTAGYGPLSDDFAWILSQIEKGVAAEDALESWAERTRSDSVKRVTSHLVRALRTGGNLSEIMITIADDVSFERKQKIADFAEKLNILGLFLLMVAVVFPTMVTILTAIGSTPSIQQYLALFSFFTPQFLFIVYFIVSPALIATFIYFVRISDPGV